MKSTTLILFLLLAGCSTKSASTTVRIANFGTGLQMCCMSIPLAQTLGYYKEEGLDVSVENLASGAKAMQALLGGSVDAAFLNYVHNLQIAAEGQHVRSFYTLQTRTTNVVLVARKSSERIQSAQDLKGALIGVSTPGGATHQFVNYYLATHGVQQAEVIIVGIGLGSAATIALESGRVDAASLVGGDHFRLLQRNPGLRILVDTTTLEGMREIYGSDTVAGPGLSAKQEWLDRNPQTARKLARALLRTQQWITNHSPEQIRQQLPEALRSEESAADLEQIRWGKSASATDGRMPKGAPEAMKRYADAMIEKHSEVKKIDLAATWTNEYLPEAK